MLSYTAVLKLQDHEDRIEINKYAKVGLASVWSDGLPIIWSPMPVVIVRHVCRASTMSFVHAADQSSQLWRSANIERAGAAPLILLH
jgi:hypothetical protein